MPHSWQTRGKTGTASLEYSGMYQCTNEVCDPESPILDIYFVTDLHGGKMTRVVSSLLKLQMILQCGRHSMV